jgi:hypothetical protein
MTYSPIFSQQLRGLVRAWKPHFGTRCETQLGCAASNRKTISYIQRKQDGKRCFIYIYRKDVTVDYNGHSPACEYGSKPNAL